MRPCLRLAVVLTSGLLVGSAAVAQQQQRPQRGPDRRGPQVRAQWMKARMMGASWWRDANLASRLSLTDEQKNRLESLAASNQLAHSEAAAAARQAYEKLLEALEAEPTTPKKVQELRQSFAEAKAEELAVETDLILGYREILSGEQFAQLRETVPAATSLGPAAPGSRSQRSRPPHRDGGQEE